nr:hypothetical protein [Paraburkholderia terrae]
MGSSSRLVWAANPHNSDGVVFQVRVIQGLQRFHVSRQTLEKVCGLAPRASDARQLEVFLQHLASFVDLALRKRPLAANDTVPVLFTDCHEFERARRDAEARADAFTAV